ncbi:hypothetical protein ETU08_11485 [Apibacter muscae]|uniref:Uncharacterized protein n=2 Tax=Apibacter muscae TaxID=2509004 RepID=A0A563D9K9_9FLAO|nr:hypothetical protein ETU09_09310 [Apibacter muscae]TWP27620.1 hypothetical protein ETU08_11485 [Apibacter muscae]
MNMLRNTLAVLLGLLVALAIITFSLMINSYWIPYDYRGVPIEAWRSVVKTAKEEFFVALLISSGVASLLGGVVCALIVKRAKKAYAMFIGFILLLTAIANVLIFKGFPTWYILSSFFVFFPSSWLGAQIVESLQKKSNKEKKKL